LSTNGALGILGVDVMPGLGGHLGWRNFRCPTVLDTLDLLERQYRTTVSSFQVVVCDLGSQCTCQLQGQVEFFGDVFSEITQ
jgi:hypothetical protein